MKYSKLVKELIEEGYHNWQPKPGPLALIDGPAVDRNFAENEVVCQECGGECRYEPWSQEDSYRAFAVCKTCDEAIEF